MIEARANMLRGEFCFSGWEMKYVRSVGLGQGAKRERHWEGEGDRRDEYGKGRATYDRSIQARCWSICRRLML